MSQEIFPRMDVFTVRHNVSVSCRTTAQQVGPVCPPGAAGAGQNTGPSKPAAAVPMCLGTQIMHLSASCPPTGDGQRKTSLYWPFSHKVLTWEAGVLSF